MKIIKINVCANNYYLTDNNYECLHSYGESLYYILERIVKKNLSNPPYYMFGAGNITNLIEGCKYQNYSYEVMFEFSNEQELKEKYPELYY